MALWDVLTSDSAAATMTRKCACAPHEVATEKVAFQQSVIHQGHEKQQCCKGARNERHKLGGMAQYWGWKLCNVLLRSLVTGIQPASKGGKAEIGFCCLNGLGSSRHPHSGRERAGKVDTCG
jgi:hypothetical protein